MSFGHWYLENNDKDKRVNYESVGAMIAYLLERRVRIHLSTIRHFDHLQEYLSNKLRRLESKDAENKS